MKLQTILISTAAFAIAAISAVAAPQGGQPQPDCCKAKSGCCPASACCTTAAAQKYTCEMHPEVISDKPGKCPKCGMNLTPVQPKK